MRIVLSLVRSGSELLFFMIEGASSLRIYAIVLVPYHPQNQAEPDVRTECMCFG